MRTLRALIWSLFDPRGYIWRLGFEAGRIFERETPQRRKYYDEFQQAIRERYTDADAT